MQTVEGAQQPHRETIEELDARLAAANLEGHWKLRDGDGTSPRPFAPAHAWDWREIRALLCDAGEITEIDGAGGRRTVRLCTPGLQGKWATPTIHASVQLVKAGEIAAAHRHSLGALRFVVEGSGAYTMVDGAKLAMEPGDLILTPPWTWHDHGHDGVGPMIWIDGHDVPFTRYLNSIFFEQYPQEQQPMRYDDVLARQRYGSMRPYGVEPLPTGQPHVYKGSEAGALLAMLQSDSFDPRFGTTIRYRDVATGGSVLPTIDCRLSRLQDGQQTIEHRTTANFIYHVVSGSGTTQAGDKELTWSEGDLFVVPGWTWQQHIAESSAGATLFSMSDEPILTPFGLIREERKAS